ncbi:hypothetical protein DM558_07240 [Entomomonas moraniae]|uniref:Periplasmic chaperone PpiD n=1 Tax=Entomomonas moraniae TaxID=2213226 RepID=A0A3Q9JIZ1_9GAMM|nr:SurA N-terminal domain-containing protein [Entomomonas moraniae]AZS50585.1 hypothetical protein DM558_07240 [Entomomonas moraniae]
MLQELRDKSQGWIAKVIIAVIVLLFALTGFDAIFRAVGHNDEVATINGKGLSKALYNSTYEQQQYILSANGQFDGSVEAKEQLRKTVMENLVNYQILIQAADNAGFGYLPAQFVEQIIQNNPLYQSNGKFDYELFKESIRNYGYSSETQYVQDQLEKYYLTQLQSGIVTADFATTSEVLSLANLINQTRNFSYKELDASTINDITKEEISAWYEKHKETLKTPEQVVLEYIVLNKNDFLDKVSISDQELTNLYAKKVNDLEEAASRKRIAHILIPVTATQTDAAAKAKIDDIAKKLKEGADFATLAKEDSQDLGTAKNGGDLGYLNSEDLPDQALAPVVNQLNQAGDLSAPVRSKYGWHIIKLIAVEDPVIPSFVSLKKSITEELKQQKAAELYLNAQRELDGLAYENYDSLSSVAEQLKLPLDTTKPFARDAGYDELTKNEKLIKEAFSVNLLKGEENSSIIELSPDRSVVIRVKQHLEPEMMTLEQATPVIVKALQTEKIKNDGEKLIAEVQAGKVVIKDWKAFNDVEQPIKTILAGDTQQKTEVAPEILDKVFSTPHPVDNKPGLQGFTLKNGNYAIIAVTKVNPFDGALTDEQKAQYQSIVETGYTNNFWGEYQKYLKDKAEVKYFDFE